MKIDDNLSEVFDVEVIKEHDVITSDGNVIPPESNQAESDFEQVRRNLHTIIAIGKEAADYALESAKSTEDPKMFNSVSAILKNLTESNLALMEIHEKSARTKVKENLEAPRGQVVQNNQQNIFVGTTSDLGNFIKGLNK